MLSFKAWEIKTLRTEPSITSHKIIPEIYFRHVEKIILHTTKYIIQWIVLMVVKYWYIIYTKAQKWGVKNWPKVYNLFSRKNEDVSSQKYSFVQRAKLELKAKIRHTKEKVRREHEVENKEVDKSL